MKATSRQALEAERGTLLGKLTEVATRDRILIERRLEQLFPPKRPDAVARELARLTEQAERSAAKVEKRAGTVPRVTCPETLPIARRREEIVQLIRENQVVILAGETGSGKTTQLPKFCLEAGRGVRGQIACTQPRRIAALSISRRVAEELDVSWGQEVGARIRFTDQTSDATLIKFVTDGMLLAEVQGDRELSAYDTIIIDEAHERSLNIDFLLGYLRQLLPHRPDLRVIVTSATLDTKAFSEAFGGAPVVEVSGRTFPVEVVYRPVEEWFDKDEDGTYVEAAARAVEEICQSREGGDVLVFMPTERDIRETCDLLQGQSLGRTEVFPLFGRLSSGEQQGVFRRTQARKVIVATNIAETSLTIPGIRFVVDSGLTRLARYHAPTRTQRLPIEPISQSSAEQRKGRAGRVAAGVCVRLYEEKDYQRRVRYTPPEIRRSNLASVILTMQAFGLGDPASFPFIDPPDGRAIEAGYALLFELGAVDEGKRLTESGEELARLPVDPTVGRMLLRAHHEHCLKEVLVIAAALSVQDPRERPADQREAADRMHNRFRSPTSDFLTLLHLWDAYHEETERLSQGKLRRFCREHFVNYQRMREWRDVHAQLERTLKELNRFRLSELEPEPDAIHRSILAGLLSNVGQKEQGNLYRATRNRSVMLFPGSVLFDAKAAEAKKRTKEADTKRSRTPEWIMAGQWLETSRIFAHTVAGIRPEWIVLLGEHLLTVTHAEPAWDRKAARVLVRERRFLYGLEVDRRRVAYGKIHPEHATELFIREALVPGEINEQWPVTMDNLAVQEQAAEWQTRLRRTSTWSLEERAVQFYLARLSGISSSAELKRAINENGESFLRMRPEDLLEDLPGDREMAAFPDELHLEEVQLPIRYRYAPGEEEDGPSLQVPLQAVECLQPAILDWAVPGLIGERVQALLRSLGKEWRQRLFPLADTGADIVARLVPERGELSAQLADELTRRVPERRIMPNDFNHHEVPAYLRIRIVVTDARGNVVVASRELEEVRAVVAERLQAHQRSSGKAGEEAWKKACEKYERGPLTGWPSSDPPGEIALGTFRGLPLVAYPGIRKAEDGPSLQLFRSENAARTHSRFGVRQLMEVALSRDLAWFERDLSQELKRVRLLYAPLGKPGVLAEDTRKAALDDLCEGALWPLRKEVFEQRLAESRKRLRGYAQRLVDEIQKTLEKRNSLLAAPVYPDKDADLARLVGPRFLARTPRSQMPELLRYLEAIRIRGERCSQDARRDHLRQGQVAPWAEQLASLYHRKAPTLEAWEAREAFRWYLEEYRVSVFAQELGTRDKVSDKRIQERWLELEKLFTP